jgi:lipid II:glycine glycyltransferase (peptidoglycan interpeptide bridge formation enzyme)
MHIVDEQITAEQWEQEAKSFKDYTLYQTWAYQYVRSKSENLSIKRVIIKDSNGCVLLMAQVRLYKLPLIKCYFGYVQNGPLICNGIDDCDIQNALLLFLKYALRERICILRVTPYVFEDEKSSRFSDLFERCGFSKNTTIPCYYTAILPLKNTREEIVKNFHRSWRRYLIKAQKEPLHIESGTDQSHWTILKNLYERSKLRKDFVGLDSNIFSETQQYLPATSKIEIIIARDESGEPVCAHATSFLGKTALGIIAASSEKGLRMNASHLVWWHTLIQSKDKGATIYDLGGIDPIKNQAVYRFKMHMGTLEIKSIGCFDFCSGPFSHIMKSLIDMIKKYFYPKK